MEETPIVGRWYYVDRIMGTTREEVLAVNRHRAVLRDTSGVINSCDTAKLIAAAPRPFVWSDVATSENCSFAMVGCLLLSTLFKEWRSWQADVS